MSRVAEKSCRALRAGLLLLAAVAGGGGRLAAQVTFTWTGGTPPVTSVAVSDTLDITTTADHNFNATALANSGTVNWQDGPLRSGSSGSITNNNAWTDTASNSLNNAFGGPTWTFTNSATGTYAKTGAGTTTFSVPFFNNGTVSVTAGTLAIAAGGSSTGGQFSTTSGTILDFTAGYTLGGTVTFSGAGTAQLSGGTLAGPATIEGPFTWLAGSFGNLTVGSTAVLTIGSAGDHNFNATAWTNNGTVSWTDGPLRSGSAGSITNNNAWTDTASNSLNNAFGGTTWTFANSATGTYAKAGAGTTTFSVPFFNQGTVNVTAGTLRISAGGSSTGGQFSATSGTILDFTAGYTLAGSVTFSGAGTAQLSGGTLAGPGTIEGAFSWLAGSFDNLTLGSTAVLTIGSAGDHNFNATAWTNNGTVSWTDGQLRSGSSGSITNHATWNDSATSSLNNAFGGTAWTFTNSAGATYNKTGGATVVSVPFNNQGTVNLTGGTLDLTGGGTGTSSSYSAGSGTTLTISNGYTITGTVTFAGPGLIQFTGGTLTGGGTIQGPISWTGGSLSAPPVFGSSSILTIGSAADHNFNATGWTTNGTVNWTGGPLRSGSAGSITNNGTWNDSAGNSMINAFGGTSWTFTNTAGATYKKTGVGTTSIAVPFTNGGTLAAGAGVLSFTSTLTLQPAGLLEFSLGGTGRGTAFGAVDANSALTLNGTLALRFAGGYESTATNGDTLTLLTLSAGSLTGAFTNVANGGTLTTLDGFGSFQVNYGAGSAFAVNSLVLSNFTAVPEPSTWALLLTGLGGLLLATRRKGRLPARRRCGPTHAGL